MESPTASPHAAASAPATDDARDHLYARVAAEYAGPLRRLTRAYELDAELQRDLFQDIQVEIWNSLKTFEGSCSLRTWVFRVAHNIGAKHILKRVRARTSQHLSLEDAAGLPTVADPAAAVSDQSALEATFRLIHRLKAIDRQIMLLYLEDLDAESIAEVVGLTAGNVATKIHRIKQLLAHTFQRSPS